MGVSTDRGEQAEDSVVSKLEQVRFLISAGQPAAAFEFACEALEQHPEDAKLQYCQALALARGGNPGHSEKLIKKLLRRSDLSPGERVDALSLSARIHKDRFARLKEPAQRAAAARRSAELYAMAFKISKQPFPGINAATMRLLAGDDVAQLAGVTSEVFELAKRSLEASPEDYWMLATLGEASLLLGNSGADNGEAGAQHWYRQAVRGAGQKLGDIASMRRQVVLLSDRIDVPKEVITTLDAGSIGVFSGHMIDHPDRELEGHGRRFPPDSRLERELTQVIDKLITELDIREGFGSAACGADILFAERLIALGRRVQIVLPFALEDFLRGSVDFGRSDDYWRGWRARCEKVLEHAGEDVHYATRERNPGGSLMFDFVNQICQGLAIQRASLLNTRPWALVVEASNADSVQGGTSDFVNDWQAKGDEFVKRTFVINLTELRNAAQPDQDGQSVSTEDKLAQSLQPAFAAQAMGMFGVEEIMLRSMLFADVSGFSSLREDQAKIFFIHFLDKVAELVKDTSDKPVFQNTWGDGLFFVFRDPAACARFALDLVETASTTDFESLGLPADLAIRAGIHTGPVFVLPDPIIGKKNVFGAHVNRTARIEPVTMPGCVYASEQMAAVLAGRQVQDLMLEYIGVANLAKGYDRCPLYQVARC